MSTGRNDTGVLPPPFNLGIFYSCSTAFGNGPGVGFALKDPQYAWFDRAYAGFESAVDSIAWKGGVNPTVGLDEHAKRVIHYLSNGETIEQAVMFANLEIQPLAPGTNTSGWPRTYRPSAPAYVPLVRKGDYAAKIVGVYVNLAVGGNFTGDPKSWFWVK